MAMKLLVILVLSVLFVNAVVEHQNDAYLQFTRFIQQYKKSYKADEMHFRFQNFLASLNRTRELNAKSKKATFGINKFSDMSPEEFKSTILMKNPITPHQKPGVEVLDLKVPQLPASFDWREKGAVTPVKDQQQCGSCWAFSVTENVESMWILARKATNTTLNLAPQQIVDCDDEDLGCEGGNPPTAYDYIIDAGGLEPSVDYPYTAQDGTCKFVKSDVVATISTWKYATSLYSETTLQTNLVAWGPLSVCVDASNWQDYQSGVMTWEECAYINILDHCVQLVGYKTNTPSGNYWIVRNSWNTDWGVQGYIYLEMGSDTCGIAHEATTAVV